MTSTLGVLLLLCVVVHAIHGYSLGDILGVSESVEPFERTYVLVPSKKSLRRLAGSGSRNCFFSPINCMITRDVSSYRKLTGPVQA